MTGTAETEAAEFEKIYKLEIVVIPTNKPMLRLENPDVVYRTEKEKYTAVAAASILARKAFLDGLKTLSERFGIELPKGSSENAAFAIETIKKRNIADKMHLMAKTHFANVKAALNRGN